MIFLLPLNGPVFHTKSIIGREIAMLFRISMSFTKTHKYYLVISVKLVIAERLFAKLSKVKNIK